MWLNPAGAGGAVDEVAGAAGGVPIGGGAIAVAGMVHRWEKSRSAGGGDWGHMV